MAYPLNTSEILTYMGFTAHSDFRTYEAGGVITLEWLSEATEPTESEINAAAVGMLEKRRADAANSPVTRSQLSRALSQLGQLGNVETLMSGDAEWLYTTQFQPRDAVITRIRKGLRKPYSFMDQAFRLARTL